MFEKTPTEVGIERRAFVKRSGLLIGVCIAGETLLMSSAEAAGRQAPFVYLTAEEAAVLARLGEIIVPGAGKAGVVHFIDSQLAVDANDSLLIARYFGIAPPFGDFYRAGVAALERSSRAAFGVGYAALPIATAKSVAAALFKAAVPHWDGPPSSLFYQCVRSDAVDVVYGTPAGFEALGVPYMEHIMPPENWS